MRSANSVAALLALAARAVALDYGAPDVTEYYETTESCSELEPITDTVTAAVTVTTCPTCEGMETSYGPHPPIDTGKPHPPPYGPPPPYPTAHPIPYPPPVVHVTSYTTIFTDVCSTGYVPQTYTITETCTGDVPVYTGICETCMPDGFTTTVKECHYCNDDNTPTSVTVTVPCDTSSPYEPHPKPYPPVPKPYPPVPKPYPPVPKPPYEPLPPQSQPSYHPVPPYHPPPYEPVPPQSQPPYQPPPYEPVPPQSQPPYHPPPYEPVPPQSQPPYHPVSPYHPPPYEPVPPQSQPPYQPPPYQPPHNPPPYQPVPPYGPAPYPTGPPYHPVPYPTGLPIPYPPHPTGYQPPTPPVCHTTTYTRTFPDVCSTGYTTQTYTVTETCTGDVPVYTGACPTCLPPDYTTTVKECTACEEHSTVSVTVTVPCHGGCGGAKPPTPYGSEYVDAEGRTRSDTPMPYLPTPEPGDYGEGSEPAETSSSEYGGEAPHHGGPTPTGTESGEYGSQTSPIEYTPGPNAASRPATSMAWFAVLLSIAGVAAGGALFL